MLKGINRIYVFFAVIYAVLFLTVGYLLFLTSGMEFEQSGSGSRMKLFLKNSSMHSINDINVFTDEKVLFMQISQLLPGEKKEVKLDLAPNFSVVYAAAPYHATISKKLETPGAGSQWRYELTYPAVLQKDAEFEIFLNLCNEGNDSNVSVEESHDVKFFQNTPQTKKTMVSEGNCSNITFKFNPIQSGKTEIFFNIKSFNFNQNIPREFEIVDLNG